MPEPNPLFILKVLSGPHLGAEVQLGAGEYRIGRDLDCDVVLSDHSLAPEHALLAIAPEGIRVQSRAGEVVIDRRLHEDPARLLPFFTMLALGTTVLTVGPEAATWPNLQPPVPGIGESAPPAAVVEGAASRAAVQEALPPAATVATKHTAGRHATGVRLAAVSVLLAAAIGVLPFLGRGDQQQTTAPDLERLVMSEDAGRDPAAATPEAAIRQRVADLGLAGKLAVEPDGAERWLVRGHVQTADERQAVEAALDELELPLRYQVMVDAQLEQVARDTLTALGRRLDTVTVEDGVLTLAGFIPEASDLQRAVDIVGRDVRGLRSIDNRVETERSILAAMQRRLADDGLGGLIRLDLENGQIIARGRVGGDRAEAWRALFDSFVEDFGRYGMPIVSEVVRVQDDTAPATVQLDVRAVGGIGRQSWVILGDGEKYLEGSLLPDGWRIERIGAAEIVLARGGQRYTHQL
jgi:type III secretion system YscD/HrpQ family protein